MSSDMKTSLDIFDQYPGTSKVWVYQCDRELSAQEVEFIENLGGAFTKQWVSHGADVDGAVKVLFNRFVIIVADDSTDIGGCSIDSSVGLIRKLEADLNTGFFNRMNLACQVEEKVETIPASQLESAFEQGKLAATSTVFNNMVTNLSELRSNWMIPFDKSWAWGRVAAGTA